VCDKGDNQFQHFDVAGFERRFSRGSVDMQCSADPTSLPHKQKERVVDVGRSVDQIVKVATNECAKIDDQVLAELHDRVRHRPSLELVQRPEQPALGACCVELLKI
jgi:hypothetical protein